MEYGYSYNSKTPCNNLLVGCGLHGFKGSYGDGKIENYTIVYKQAEDYIVTKGQYSELEGKNISKDVLFTIKKDKVTRDTLGPIAGDPSTTYHCVFDVNELKPYSSHPSATHQVVLTTDQSAIDALKANRGGFRRRKTRRTRRTKRQSRRRRGTRRRR